MENASRAITIAGGVLLSTLVISILVFGYSKLRNYQKAQKDGDTLLQISEFNKQFEAYNSKVVTGYKMVTLAHMTIDLNERYSEDKGYKKVSISLSLKNSNGQLPGNVAPDKNGNFDLCAYMNTFDNLQTEDQRIFKQLYFECDNVEYGNNGRITGMTFKEITKKE